MVSEMTPTRLSATISTLVVGGVGLFGSLALGMLPLLGGWEECAASTSAEVGEGSFDAAVSVSLFPYGASCAFKLYETGAVLSPGPSPIWTIAIVIGFMLVVGAAVALALSSVSGRPPASELGGSRSAAERGSG